MDPLVFLVDLANAAREIEAVKNREREKILRKYGLELGIMPERQQCQCSLERAVPMEMPKKKITVCREGADSERLKRLVNNHFPEGELEIKVCYETPDDVSAFPFSYAEQGK